MSTVTTTSLLSPPFPAPRFTTPAATSRLPSSFLPLKFTCITISRSRRSKPFLVRVDDGEGNAGGDDYDMNEDEAEEVDNKIRDLEGAGGGPDDDTAVEDYPINEYEDEFHKISSLDSDLFLDPDPFPMYKTASGMRHRRNNPFLVRVDDGGGDAGGDDYDMDEDEAEEVGNKRDFEVEYDPLKEGAGGGPDDDIAIDGVQSTSFMSIQGWDSDMVVDYRINEDEFHKISLLDCDFFIRKPPDPDNDVFDFREMYVTPPDTDVYSIPRVLAPMPHKYIRCAVSDYGGYNVTEPPIDAPRDPMVKSEREVTKVFLTKHYRNRRLGDPEFVLDFEEIYVIDSKTKSITRAKVIVTVPGGTDRDRKDDMLIIRDSGNSFKVINSSQRDDPTTVIEREEWDKSRYDMERHLSKLRDFSISNWF